MLSVLSRSASHLVGQVRPGKCSRQNSITAVTASQRLQHHRQNYTALHILSSKQLMLVGVHACQWCVRCAGGCEQRRTFHRQSQGAQVCHRGRILLQLQLKLQQQSRDGILHLEHRKVLPEANTRTSLCCVGLCGTVYGVE
jgi:hypothetical protein